MNLKKVVMAGSLVFLGFVLVQASAYAQMDKSPMQMRSMSPVKQMFVDENGDGICDNRMDMTKMAQNMNQAGMMDNHDEMMKDHQAMKSGMTGGGMSGMTNSTMRHQMGPSGTGMTGGTGSMNKGGMHG
jgi:hypothetical protein